MFSNLNLLNRISLSWRQEFKVAAKIEYDAKKINAFECSYGQSTP